MNQNRFDLTNSVLAVKQNLMVLRRNWNAVLVSGLLLAILGIVAISLLPNVYRATTTILVDPQKIPERYVASTVTSDPNARLNTLTQEVLSASRLQQIIDQSNLYPELRRNRSREEVLDYMRGKIKIELKEGSEQGLSSFSITYEDNNRALVAPITNQLASSFIDWNLKQREQQAFGTTQFLASELQLAKKSLEEQEEQLQAFRLQHTGATPDQLTGNLQALDRLQSQVQANIDAINRLDSERILLTQTGSSGERDPASLTERGRLLQEKSRLETELWNLKRQFTDTYPDVIAAKEQLKNVTARLAALPAEAEGSANSYDANTKVRLSLISKELERRKQQQISLQKQISSYQGKVEQVPVLETQLTQLTRNYETSRKNYQSLLDKTFSAGMSEDLEHKQQAERFTILDPAKTPEKPFKPKRLPAMAAATLFAFLFSTGIAIGLNSISSTIKSEAELKGMLPLKIQVLGTIPPIVSRGDVQRGRIRAMQTAIVSGIACLALIVFLLKVRPIL